MLKKILFISLSCFALNTAFAAQQEAIFAGGCFWCLEADFDKLPGVIATTAGYDGGSSLNPSYETVSSGATNYAESVKITFDDSKITYPELLNYFWHHIDPTVKDAQFCDHGKQYRTAIFYLNNTQKKQALASRKIIAKKFPTIYTEIVPSTHFYPAEEYHQNYYKKNPIRYKYYRWNCGRDARVKEVWNGK